jgi:hypothetical protein
MKFISIQIKFLSLSATSPSVRCRDSILSSLTMAYIALWVESTILRMQRNTSAINATFARRARLRRRMRDIGDTCATCARFRRTFPRLSAIGRLTSHCVFPCPTKFPGVYFSIYHLFQHRTMFIFTLHSLYTFLQHFTDYHIITFYHHHTTYHLRVFIMF